MPGEKQLTPKQEAFVKAYRELGNATEAYEQIYNVRKTMTRSTSARNAHVLLDNPKVLAELNRQKEEATALINQKTAKTHEQKLAEAIAEQEFAMQMASQTGNATAYSAAAERKAKLNRVFVEQSEVRTGQLDPEEAKPDIAELWTRVTPHATQEQDSETKH